MITVPNDSVPFTLTDIINRRTVVQRDLAARKQEFEEFRKLCEAELAQLREDEALTGAGVDLDRLRRGLRVVEIEAYGDWLKDRNGGYPDQVRSGGRAAMIEEAKRDLAAGAPHMRSAYFGIKNYAHFGDQRADGKYHLGPKHGNIVFRIGLTSARRQNATLLSPEEIEDAIYTLVNLHVLAEARKGIA